MDKKTILHIINILRKGTITWHVRKEVLKNSRVKAQEGFYKNGKEKWKWLYYCEKCKKEFRDDSMLEVDHIKEIGSFKGTWDDYISKVYCEIDNLQVLCIPCHDKKTSGFNASLRYERKNSK